MLLEDGKVAKLAARIPARGAQVIEADGLVVCPGFIDIHTHLREPGREDKETIASGTRAAAAGGFTAVCAMPNTHPVNDTAGITRAIVEKARAEGGVRVYPIGAITRGQQGEELAEFGDLQEAGCVAFSDDGKPVASARMMRRALEYARTFGLVLIDHCEEPTLAEKACMNEGPVSTFLGLRGAPAAGEAIMVERDVLLAELTGGRVHIAHLSAAASLDAVRRGKARGVKVTAEVTPHHLFLTDEAVRETGYDTNTKMNPPLRAEPDRAALHRGAARRDDRLHRDRPRAAHGRRQARRVRPGGLRHRRPRDRRAALPRPAGGSRARRAVAARGAAVDEPRARARACRGDARARLARRPDAAGSDEAANRRPGPLREPQPQHAVWGLGAPRLAGGHDRSGTRGVEGRTLTRGRPDSGTRGERRT